LIVLEDGDAYLVLHREGDPMSEPLECWDLEANDHPLLQAMSIAAYTCDATGLITFFNRSAAEVWGREPLLNDPVDRYCGSFRLFSAGGSPIAHEQSWMARALDEDREYCGQEVVIERPDGSRRIALAHAAPFHDPEGRICGAVNILLDITDKKRAEDELRLRARALESFLQGVCIADARQPDYPIIYVNQGFVRMTGYAPEEVLGRNCRLLQGPGTDPAAVAHIRAAIHEGQPCLVELVNYHKDGTTFWNALSLAPCHDAAGRLTHFVGVQTDITPFKKIESQLQQAQKMEAIGRLAGGVAHDFNNLITVINGYSELLLGRLGPEDPLRGLLSEVSRAGERATSLTRQLLALGRQQVLEPKVLDLNAEVSDAEKMLCRVLGEDMILTTVLEPTLGRVKVDPGQMHQVLLNLAFNARDAMPQGGRLTIETHNVTLDKSCSRAHPNLQPGTYSMLAVSDTGVGMDEATKSHIFEPFFTTKAPGKGTGLGLATVHGIVKQSGGSIEVYSERGLGTTFKVYLPQVTERLSAGKAPADLPLPGGSETVLLAEDEDGVRAVTGHILRQCGYAVLEAADGKAAVRLTERHQGRIDLLVSDVVMPHFSGRQLVERLLMLKPELKVLFLSGYPDDAIVGHGVLGSDFAFLQKPFTAIDLAQKVREVLDSCGFADDAPK
jgi:PAS domain S-box-containing protein